MCLAGQFAVDDQGNREPAGDSLRADARQEAPLFAVIAGEQHLDAPEAQTARRRAILLVEENRNRLFVRTSRDAICLWRLLHRPGQIEPSHSSVSLRDL